jgi:hypothetical protein
VWSSKRAAAASAVSPFHSQKRGTGRAKEGADGLDGDPERDAQRVARDKLRDGRGPDASFFHLFQLFQLSIFSIFSFGPS